MIYLELDTSNAAFADGNSLAEVARIFQKVVNEIETYGEMPETLRDINGNKVGIISYVNPLQTPLSEVANSLLKAHLGEEDPSKVCESEYRKLEKLLVL